MQKQSLENELGKRADEINKKLAENNPPKKDSADSSPKQQAGSPPNDGNNSPKGGPEDKTPDGQKNPKDGPKGNQPPSTDTKDGTPPKKPNDGGGVLAIEAIGTGSDSSFR